MPLEEGTRGSAKHAEKCPEKVPNRMSTAEEPVAGPSSSQRQGYCSCCQVLYNSVEQHILSVQHREVVRAARAKVSSGSLLERFLQDVLKHHPRGYSDARPTHADLPFLTTPPIPKEEFSEVCCGSDDDGVSVGTREEMPSSDDEACHMLTETTDISTSAQAQTTSQTVNLPSENNSPTRVFLHRTSGCSAKSKPQHITTSSQQASPDPHPSGAPEHPRVHSERPPVSNNGSVKHKKAHRKTNRTQGSDSSSHAQPKSKPVTTVDSSSLWITTVPPWKGLHRKQTFSHQSDQIREVIENVIKKHCYGIDPQEDEGSFLLNSHCMSASMGSEEWDIAIQTALGTVKGEEKNLVELLEKHVNLKDQGYQNQLNTALNTVGPAEGPEQSGSEDVFPSLPHIPQCFVGKTRTEVMFEDDMKIESIVRDFQHGSFRCYFDSESLARFGKHRKRRKKKTSTGQKSKVAAPGWEPADMLPLMEHAEDHTQHRSTKQKIYRLASRCQVVKVSHATQTIQQNFPAVRIKSPQEANNSKRDQDPQQCASEEKTPDMKTRMCSLKLPPSYGKIMTPLQPKTVVYVLSSPDGEQGNKPNISRKPGRKRKSCDDDTGIKYKYKRTPLKFYDPLTNRILKSPPKGVALSSNSKSLTHVRQLFRSLSPDINKERQGQSPKSRGRSSLVDLCAATSESCLESGGPSENESSLSSSHKRALFTRSSISSSKRFLIGRLAPSAHLDESSKHHSQSGSCSADQLKHIQNSPIEQTPIRRSPRRCGPLTPAKRPAIPPYRPKRTSSKPQHKARTRMVVKRTASSRKSAECRSSRTKRQPKVSLRSKSAIPPVITASSQHINTVLGQHKRLRGRTPAEHPAD